RVNRQGTRQADALLHAAAELIRIMVLESGKADQLDVVVHSFDDPFARKAGDLESKGDVVHNGFPGQQSEVLENNRDAGARRADRLTIDRSEEHTSELQ